MDSLSQGQNSTSTVIEYSVRVPKNGRKNHHMMRFNMSANVMDFLKWPQTKMARENNMKDFKGYEDDQPKFGAGSEFGREQREEARRKKYGIQMKKYRPDDQPWLLKIGGKTGKRYKGVREGGIAENTAYYVFKHATDGAFEAYPVHEWYNFTPIQRYKALSAEEAEEEFGRRNKILNYFTLMTKKRLKNEEDGDLDEEEGKAKGRKKKKELQISEADDWIDSDIDDSDEEDEEKDSNDEDGGKKAKKKAAGKKAEKKKKKKKQGSDDEAMEESDDGDEEGREVDYMSDSSSGSEDLEEKAKSEMKGVAEEDALKKLLNSDEEDEEEEGDKEASENEEEKEAAAKEGEEKDSKSGNSTNTSVNSSKKTKKKKKSKNKKKSNGKEKGGKANDDSSSDLSVDSSDAEAEAKKASSLKIKESNSSSSNSSRATTPTKTSDGQSDGKRKGTGGDLSLSKKIKLEGGSAGSAGMGLPAGSSDAGISEDSVRRYLMRKPMTTIELLQKFKSKKTGLSSEQLVTAIAQVLRKINPVKQMIKGKMYLSIKS